MRIFRVEPGVGQRGTGQIREKVKEDEIGIGIADAASLRSEPGMVYGTVGNTTPPRDPE